MLFNALDGMHAKDKIYMRQVMTIWHTKHQTAKTG